MSVPYKKIRDRYEHAVNGVEEGQMYDDIHALFRYIDALHQIIMYQAAQRALEEAAQAFVGCDEDTSLPN